MNESIFFYTLFLLGVAISAFAQILLKKNANRKIQKNVFTYVDDHLPKLSDKINNSETKLWCVIRKYKKLLSEYLNPFSIVAYSIFIAATLLTIVSYKVVPLSVAPILGATEYFFIAVLSKLILKESINSKKAIGLLVIVIGIIVYSI